MFWSDVASLLYMVAIIVLILSLGGQCLDVYLRFARGMKQVKIIGAPLVGALYGLFLLLVADIIKHQLHN
jgi:hypothetical protein